MDFKDFLASLPEEEQQEIIGRVGVENLNYVRVFDLNRDVDQKNIAIKLATAPKTVLKIALLFAAQIIQQGAGMPESVCYSIVDKLLNDALEYAEEIDEDDE